MINGDGARDKNIAQLTSPDPFGLPLSKSDGGGDGASLVSSPQYSSCGESDLERYCSANSGLGTPSSIATFNDCFGEFDSGSVRSVGGFGLGDSFENFSLDGNQIVPFNGRIESQKDGIRERIVNVNSVEKGGSICLDTELREEDGNSLRYEHSEGEDSMYNYGIDDDEHKNDSYYWKKDINENENRDLNENPLVINSSVAFGSNDWDDFEQEASMSDLASFILDSSLAREKVLGGVKLDGAVCSSGEFPIDIPNSFDPELVEEAKDVPVVSYQEQGRDDLVEDSKHSLVNAANSQRGREAYMKDIPVNRNQVQDADDDMKYLETCSVTDVFAMEQDYPVEKASVEIGLDVSDSDRIRQDAFACPKEVVAVGDGDGKSERQEIGHYTAELDPLAVCANPVYSAKKINAELFDKSKPDSPTSKCENFVSDSAFKKVHAPADGYEEHPGPVKMEKLELNEFYDEVVHDMEEILLESVDSPGVIFPRGNRMFQSQLSLPLRDGGSTASTSGADDAYLHSAYVLRIDDVEVVGARQKKGDISLSERLVGVKEFTVYKIRVRCGNDHWEVERRYRDFCTLHRRLKSLFSDQGWSLPPPWLSLERQSRKIFGNAAPDVIAERSVLIQECLRSIIHSRSFSSPPSALIWFLSPQDSFPSTPPSKTMLSQSTYLSRGIDAENVSPLGKTISLIVEIRPPKSMKQMLEAQNYTCAGCHKHFDDGMTLMRDLVQSLGWGKPRLCEYTGQLFCSSCHTNEMAILPARVLHNWDFTRYPVSQLAKSYLDSIHDQPMLCVSAVNPFLFTKVPVLQHVMGIRKKIVNMLPYVRCPFRMSINKGFRSRRYLLESNDFFALRDLIDLSKGAFAALPVMAETVSRKIEGHIVERCLVCCDVGIPCSARQSCDDPSSLIFPFQEGEIEKCASCGSVFHKHCFKKLANCPCGALLREDEAMKHSNGLLRGVSFGASGALGLLGKRSSSALSSGVLPGLFSKTKPEGIEHKDDENIILMGSLPSNYF